MYTQGAPTPYTDLALEAAEPSLKAPALPGLQVSEDNLGPVVITRVSISSPEAARAVGKPPGTYITLEADIKNRPQEMFEPTLRALEAEFSAMAKLAPDSSVLVAGLGNWNSTPDALGPRVVNLLFVTRHLKGRVSDQLADQLRPVSAIAPGVLGLTGIETGEIVNGLVEHVKPDLLVVVDALAAASLDRMLTTVQLSDTGIQPGSGVGSHTIGITPQTLGIPVVAIGVPTVVHALTIASATMGALASRPAGDVGGTLPYTWQDPSQRQRFLEKVLAPDMARLMVTPKEIDKAIKDWARLVATALNQVLHPELGEDGQWG